MIRDFTDESWVKLLSTTARRTDITPIELCQAHKEMGKMLAYQMLEEFAMEEIDIPHVQGIRKGFDIKDKEKVSILVMMRSGLYFGEGIREIFPFSSCFMFVEFPTQEELASIGNNKIIISDAVINTGKSMINLLDHLYKHIKQPKIIVSCQVVQKKSVSKLEKLFPEIAFYTIRISENQYTGKGGTDTGNRLFNTSFLL